MRRLLPVVIAGLGLSVLVWLFVRSVRDPALPASPKGASVAMRTEEEPARAQVDATERSLEPTAVEEPAVAPGAEAPALWTDPTELELAEFERSIPAGTIEGILLRGLKPVEGGQAWLGAESTGGLPWGSAAAWDAEPSVSRTAIGADGVFRFSGLQPDTYGVGVRTTDGTTRHVYLELHADEPTRRIRIVLGGGGLRGHVFDERGGPCVGWKVAAYNWGNTLAGVQVIDGRETDAAGAFEFGGLVGGNYVLSAGPVADRRDPLTRTLMVELPPGQWKTVDFGASRRAASWSGRVLLPDGAPMRLAAASELWLQSEGVRETTRLTYEGAFQVQLASGTYSIALFAYTRVGAERLELGEIQLSDSDRAQDLVLPRATLRVRANYQGTQMDKSEAAGRFSTWLTGSDRSRTGLRGADGNEYFLGLEPGEYQLSSFPPIQGAPGGKIPVQIREQDQVVELDLVVGDP
jgi:hypothetical protein